MALLKFGEGIAVATCGSKLRIFSYRTDYSSFTEDLQNQEEILPQRNAEKQNERDTSSESKTTDPQQKQPTGAILSCNIHRVVISSLVVMTGKTSTCGKLIHGVFFLKGNIPERRSIQKRCTSVTFTPSEEFVLLADKFGDVYQFSVKTVDEPGSLLLGHVSMLLDVAATPDNKFIITCDRDEKIRVSCFPNAYNIHGYCLGHTQFVSCFKIVPGKENLLVSAGGLWDYHDCKQLASVDINHESRVKKPEEYFTVTHLTCSKNGYVAISLLGEIVCLVYKVLEDSSGYTLKEVSKMHNEADIFCITFDLKGCLWVIQGSPVEAVQVFQLSDLNEKVEVTRATSFAEAWQKSVLELLNKEWEFLKDSLNADQALVSLHKKNYNHMQEYMNKKQQRIADEEIRKEKYEARLARQEQRKRMKVENKDESKM
ncbi:putative tRNA (guanine-N(7)-)-methyltransferase non-catalytic subunit wdr4-like [Apostichopus japonicus]|uniref:tRNA (guanine-N(7)-)-methyltransferase non-catalytic subunit n=1 Tax=Stichopus japonicus TaxID=307972 RepID=A0A2G8KB56_STIJA|nr:putative tRNA (guanine-N(7)-)-methyltransferase non-catalytic subunit wdr4-like [Apostichopus japonicus]